MKPFTIYVAGDSTAANYLPEHAPMEGWGAKLHLYLRSSIRVVNEAVNGRSSKSFIEEGRLDSILDRIQSGDFLLVQFGHNDSKEDAERHTSPWHTYPNYLQRYIQGARDKGATPILISPLCRRHFDGDGLLINTHGDYPRSAEALCVRDNVTFIDLNGRSAAAFKELGEARSKQWFTWLQPGEHANYPEGIEDDTHLNEHGAQEVSKIVADALIRHYPIG
ncbi:lysophospholipase L1-like esterase [Paenibacillus phyllosphaerae]|uniref:Lysophospholipase L1-like esterase n=1 Tax=Paenibacillus phyllosphaerae TaxID=274593 RepID=A0A7W5AT07_9BACL|nr:rhamnogalacturonan acetylesterase [Paenibacillus phyllosphaerae]MBB3108112.1 lysophospholipase L1-like esterase [Paenibacillus phyllosphaerae]